MHWVMYHLTVPRYWLSTFGCRAFSVAETLHRIVTVIQHRVLTVLGNYVQHNSIICEILNILSTVDAS